MYKTNHVVKSSEWKEILSSAYIWFDWGSMPQPSAYPLGTPKKKIEKSQTDLRNAVGSIPSYVEKSDFVVIVAPGCLHFDRRDPETKLRTKTCYRTYVANDFFFFKWFSCFFRFTHSIFLPPHQIPKQRMVRSGNVCILLESWENSSDLMHHIKRRNTRVVISSGSLETFSWFVWFYVLST